MATSMPPLLLCTCVFLLFLLLPTAHCSYPDLDRSEIEALGLTDDDLVPYGGDDQGDYLEGEYGEFESMAEYDEASPELADFDAAGDGSGHSKERLPAVADSDVVILSESNFSTFLNASPFAMVEFYAPWCGHCQALAPEYAAAATELLAFSVPVPLAKVDATVYPDLAQKYDVEGFPTVFFFANSEPKVYSHHHSRDAIVSWVKKRIGPAVAKMTSTDDAQTIFTTGKTVVVAFFENPEGPEVEALTATAQEEDHVSFYQTENKEVADALSFPKAAKAPALVLLKNVSEKFVFYDGDFTKDSLSQFIAANKLPLVSTFDSETAAYIFEGVIKKQMLLFASPEEFQKILPSYEEAAKIFKGKIIFVHVDTSNEEVARPVVHFFGVDVEKPMILGFTVSEDEPKSYLFEGEMTFDKIKEFAAKFSDNKLKQFYKTQPLPDRNDEDVKVVVGLSFDQIVLDESKDVLLEIYAPWCGHCQALEPIYTKLARAMRGVDSLVIAKMDGTTNDHSRAKVDGYPTILFFAAGNKSFDPIVVDSERSVKELYQFLKQNAGIPFTLSRAPKTNETLTMESPKVTDQILDSSHSMKDEL